MRALLLVLGAMSPAIAFYIGKYGHQFIAGLIEEHKIRQRKEKLRLERERDTRG